VRWVKAAAPRAREITLRLVGSSEARRLNLAYRGRDYATNVLTFVYDASLAGDIVLCPAVIAREARAQGKKLEAHYAHMCIHGALHLLGYDHERDADARRMEAREKALLRLFGVPDPYAG
jgi:probable rRNA maturation factor